MNKDEVNLYIAAVGGKRKFARLLDISESYTDKLSKGKKVMSSRLAELIRLKIPLD